MTTDDVLACIEHAQAEGQSPAYRDGLTIEQLRVLLHQNHRMRVGDGQRLGRILAELIRDEAIIERNGRLVPVDRSRGGF